jgi:hypothetical protein
VVLDGYTADATAGKILIRSEGGLSKETSMDEEIKKKLAELSETHGSFVVYGSSIVGQMHQLTEAATALGLESHEGSILAAGVNGVNAYKTYFVAFYVIESKMTYQFYWPQWAYEVALQSLLHKKRLLIVTNGAPVEPPLEVIILQTDL